MTREFRVGDIVNVKKRFYPLLMEPRKNLTIVEVRPAFSDRGTLIRLKERDGSWFAYRFELAKSSPAVIPPLAGGYVKQEFSVRYAHTPKDTKRVVERVVRRMKRKMPAWLFDGILVAMLEEAKV